MCNEHLRCITSRGAWRLTGQRNFSKYSISFRGQNSFGNNCYQLHRRVGPQQALLSFASRTHDWLRKPRQACKLIDLREEHSCGCCGGGGSLIASQLFKRLVSLLPQLTFNAHKNTCSSRQNAQHRLSGAFMLQRRKERFHLPGSDDPRRWLLDWKVTRGARSAVAGELLAMPIHMICADNVTNIADEERTHE